MESMAPARSAPRRPESPGVEGEQTGVECDKGARSKQHRCRFVAPGATGERQEHLDAIDSFAGAGQRRHLFRGLDILTIKWASGDLLEECRFLLNAQPIFLKEEDPTPKQIDDDEWIRSLTEAQEVTSNFPDSVDPTKVRPFQMWEFLRKCVSRRLLALSEGEIAA